MTQPEVLIAGGGISGLSAAHFQDHRRYPIIPVWGIHLTGLAQLRGFGLGRSDLLKLNAPTSSDDVQLPKLVRSRE